MTAAGPERETCRRAREWASRRLDGELSEFESALLEAHLDRCRNCESYTAGIEAVAARMRGSVLAPLSRAVVLPPRQSVTLRSTRVVAAMAAAALVAVVGLASDLALSRPSRVSDLLSLERIATSPQSGGAELRQLKAVRIAQMRPQQLSTSVRPIAARMETGEPTVPSGLASR